MKKNGRWIGFTVGELTEMNWCQLSKEQTTTAERSKGEKTPQHIYIFFFFLKKKEKGTIVYIDQLMQLLYISQIRSIEKYLHHWLTCTVENNIWINNLVASKCERIQAIIHYRQTDLEPLAQVLSWWKPNQVKL